MPVADPLLIGPALVVLATALGLRLAPKLAPKWRAWIWRCVFIKLLIGILPIDPIQLPWLPAAPTTVSYDGPIAPEGGIDANWILLAVGLVLAAAGALRSYAAGQRIRATAEEVTDARACEELQRLRTASRLGRSPLLLESREQEVPTLLAGHPPAIVLPATYLARLDDLRMALAHEVGHLARRDLAWSGLGMVTRSIFFYHPLVWLAVRAHADAQESATDELAIHLTSAPVSAYADLLLRASQRQPANPLSGGTGLAMAGSFRTVERRIQALKNLPTHRRPLPALRCVAPFFALAFLPTYQLVPAPPAPPAHLIPPSQSMLLTPPPLPPAPVSETHTPLPPQSPGVPPPPALHKGTSRKTGHRPRPLAVRHRHPSTPLPPPARPLNLRPGSVPRPPDPFVSGKTPPPASPSLAPTPPSADPFKSSRVPKPPVPHTGERRIPMLSDLPIIGRLFIVVPDKDPLSQPPGPPLRSGGNLPNP